MRKKVLQYFLAIPPWTKLIKDLNPIFWIEDMTVVVDGKLVDKSGNNKQITVSTDDLANDTITLPANDADIIAALMADGIYYQFYDDDNTPRALKIGQIITTGSRRLYSYYSYKHFCLFTNAPSQEDQEKLYSHLHISKAFLPDVNMVKQLNFSLPKAPTNTINESDQIPFFLMSGVLPVTYEDNNLNHSVSKKTIITRMTLALGETLNARVHFTGGSLKISYWIKNSEVGNRGCSCMIYTGRDSNDTRVVDYNPGTRDVGYKWSGVSPIAYNGELKERVDGWDRVEIELFAFGDNIQNLFSNFYNNLIAQIGLRGGTVVEQDMHNLDFVVAKDYAGTLSYNLEGPYEKMQSKLVGKKIVSAGSSISVDYLWMAYMSYLYGIDTFNNCGHNGAMMAKTVDAYFIPDSADALLATNSDIIIIFCANYGANSSLGDINSVDDDEFCGGYNNFLTYLRANKNNEKIVLVTAPLMTAGYTTTEQKAAAILRWQNMADAVKAIGLKHNVQVCDLHGQFNLTFNNAGIYLSDGVHWTYAMHRVAGDIVGKFINDLY